MLPELVIHSYLLGLVDGKIEVCKYRQNNVKLLEALMEMVAQFFHTHEDVTLSHNNMTAEECAIKVLLELGLAQKADATSENRYHLLWDKLETIKRTEGA